MKLFGYGEDSLTLWAVTSQLAQVLDQLHDDTDPCMCTVFYRPSFGRGDLIGEFDAIIIGAKIAYLIESKWDQSRMPVNVLQLNHTQHRRHQILRWFHRMWHHEPWNQFIDQFDREFYDSFQKHIASEDNKYWTNQLVRAIFK